MADVKGSSETRKSFPAPCDIYQDNGKVVLSMEMPGVTKEHLEIKVDGDRLIIDGKRGFPDKVGEYHLREIRDGDFHHEFTLDDTIDRGKIEAVSKNGVVTLTLKIKESEQPRKINVVAK